VRRVRIDVRGERRVHQVAKPVAALDVIAKLVEARARRRQQHGVARLCDFDCARYRAFERLHMLHANLRGCERVRDLRRIAADQEHRATAALDALGERREALPLAVAARDQDRRPADALERDLRRRDGRALGIVDVQHATGIGHRRHPMRQPAELRERVEHRAADLRDRGRECERGKGVQRVVAADEREPRRVHNELSAAREPGAVGPLHEAPFLLGERHARAERLQGAPGQSHQPHDRIVAVQYLNGGLREDARLRAGVIGDARVAVEVVGRDVENGGRDRPQARRRLELEARQLQHEHLRPRLVRLAARELVEHGVADVARDDGRQSRGRRERPRQRGHRRLAVGAGDRQHLLVGRQRAREELDVTDDLDAGTDGRLDRRRARIDAGTDGDQLRTIERRIREGAGRQRDSWKLGRQHCAVRRIGARVCDANLGAVAHEMADQRQSGRAEAQHDGARSLEFLGDVHFSAVSASTGRRAPAAS
jgi:hypothetical protein